MIMKQTRKSLRLILQMFVVTAMLAGFQACDDDDVSSPLTLRYMEIGNIGTGMGFEATPYYQGITPTDFSIEKVKWNGEDTENNGFLINAETGVITISHQNQLAPGTYTLTIACKAEGQVLSFPDVLTVNMLPAAPQVFKYRQPVITSEYGRFDTAYVAEISESVQIDKFILAEEGDATYFDIDATTGTVYWKEFPISQTPEPRHYYPAIGIVTPSGTQFYNNVLEYNIISAPMKLQYEIAEKQTEKGYTDTSAMPVYTGSPDQLAFAIKSAVCGETSTDKIHITADGRIYIDKNSENVTKGDYSISVSVTNQYGSKDFDNVFTWKIVDYIAPIENFAYAETTCHRLKAFSIPVADGFQGDGVTFSFANPLPAALSDLTIDPNTGEISAPQKHKLSMGDYTIEVKAVNSKAQEGIITTLTLHVKEHPNYFSISYGNNLGLIPEKDYANQYTFPKGGEDITIQPNANSLHTEGVRYSLFQFFTSNPNTNKKENIVLDGNTGAIQFKIAGQNAGGMSVIMVKAEKGSGEDVYTVITPVFVQNASDSKNAQYSYKPFVWRVNPKTGGTCNFILQKDQGMTDAGEKLRIDFKDQLMYCDLREDYQHLSSTGNTTQKSELLTHLWKTYFPVNTDSKWGDRGPMSYYSDNQYDTENLNRKICYIDQMSYQLHLNPGIWKDERGNYVNGIFWAKSNADLNGNKPAASGNANAAFPVAIWLDPEF